MIPLAKPSIDQQEIEAMAAVLLSGQLVQGLQVKTLEERIKEYLSVGEVVVVSSGTAALHLGLLALDLKAGDEVIVPNFTFPATAHAVVQAGGIPVMVDVESHSCNIDPQRIEEAITSRTRAIVPVDEFGFPAEIGAINQIAQKHNLVVFEDAACALGSEYQGRKCGTAVTMAAFSLHPRKSVTTGEGGFVVFQDSALAKKVRLLANHGMEKQGDTIDFLYAGLNYRLTEFQAAMGLVQMQKLPKILERRAILAQRYSQLLVTLPVQLPSIPVAGKHTFQSYHLVLPKQFNRAKVISLLAKTGIGTNYGAYALNLLTSLKGYCSKKSFPVSEQLFRQGLVLPLYEQMTEREQDFVVEQLAHVLASDEALCRS